MRSRRVDPLAVLAVLLLIGPAQASDWKVVAEKSWLGFAGSAGSAAFGGRFARWQAQIAFDPASAEHGHVVVSVDMTSAVTGDPQKDKALPQAAWFDAAHFPQAMLQVQSFRAKGGDDYDAVATLTIRDVTKEVVMPVTIEVSGNTLHAKGQLDLLRTDYGVGAATGAQWVALEVSAKFDVTAKRVP